MAKESEPLGRRSARTFSVLTAGRTLSLLIGILSIIIVGRLLGPVGYGVFTLAFAFFLLLSAASNFGFGQYLIKHLSEAEDKHDREAFARALGSGFLLVALIGLLLVLFGIGISGYVASLFASSGATAQIFIIAASIVFFAMMYGTSDYALIGVGKNAAAASLEIFENIVLLVASVALVEMGYGAAGAIAGILISYISAGALGTYLIFSFAHKKMRVRGIGWPTFKELRGAFGFSLPIAGNNFLSNSIVSFATLLLGFFVSAYALGNFGIANRARTVLAVFYTTAAVTLVPTLTLAVSRESKQNQKRRLTLVYNKALVYSLLASVPLIAYLGVYSTPLVYFLISQNFGTAPLYLSLIALGTILGLVGVYAMNLFIARGRTSKLMSYAVICTAVQLVALAALVPTFGVLGAIVSLFFVGSLVGDYLFMRGTRTVLGLKTDYNKLLRAFGSNIALAAVFALGLLSLNFALQLAYGLLALIVVYPFFLVLFGSIDSEELLLLREAIEKLPGLRLVLDPILNYFGFLVRYMR